MPKILIPSNLDTPALASAFCAAVEQFFDVDKETPRSPIDSSKTFVLVNVGATPEHAELRGMATLTSVMATGDRGEVLRHTEAGHFLFVLRDFATSASRTAYLQLDPKEP
jgi:hypothetical protein